MRIEDFRIERFGRWQELTLSLPEPAVNVLYGPNEAGKSTLLRFVRGVLYGRPHPRGERDPDELHGRLVVERDGDRHVIDRRFDTRGDVAIVEPLDGPRAELADLLQGVERPFFERIFAVGLREMQELGTLDDAAVADWLYGTSLGPAGRRLGEIAELAESERSKLVGEHGTRGRIADLTAEYARIARAIAELGSPELHDGLRTEKDELDSTIGRLKGRQETTQRNLRGYRVLQRVHEPWTQVREYRTELARLGGIDRFPKNGLASLDRIEAKIDETRNRRDAAKADAKRLLAEYRRDRAADPLGEHGCTVRALLEQRDEICDVQERLGTIAARAREDRTTYETAIGHLGPEWSEKRLDRVPDVRDGHRQFAAAARDYQKALIRKARLRRLRRRLEKAVQKRQAELHTKTRALAGNSVKGAIDTRRQRLVDLEDLGRLRVKAAELEQRRESISEQVERSRERAVLPDWVYGVLVFFGIVGAIFCVLGAVTGISTSMLVGAIYAFLGVTAGGLGWAIKVHFEEELRDTLRRLRDDEHAAEVELRQTHERIAKLCDDQRHPIAVHTGHGRLTLQQQQARDAELLSKTVRELVDLERLAERIESTVKLRKRHTAVRNRFHSLQRELGTSRQQWNETIRQLGLTETLKIDEATAEWDLVATALDTRRRLRATEAEMVREREGRERFRTRLRRIADELGETYDDATALEMLDRWERQLEDRDEHLARRRRLRTDVRRRRREYESLKGELARWKRRRSLLFAKSGAVSHEEYRRLAGSIERRRELEELLALAEADLEAATRGDDDLAIVEEQLCDFDPAGTREAIEFGELELEEIADELARAHERLGSVKRDLADAERDTRSADLRFEREQVYEQLVSATRDLVATEVTDGAIDATIEQLEHSHQPPTLAAASRYLSKLTLGRYDRIWTPFGESKLLVNGDGREALGVEKLSRGTREQVFLALRLAMIEGLADDGVRLPLVLDDVFVNFDRERTEAAVDTLIEFATAGRQVLFFTCHLHVAEMFEQRDLEPVWLPANETRVEERIAG